MLDCWCIPYLLKLRSSSRGTCCMLSPTWLCSRCTLLLPIPSPSLLIHELQKSLANISLFTLHFLSSYFHNLPPAHLDKIFSKGLHLGDARVVESAEGAEVVLGVPVRIDSTIGVDTATSSLS